MRISNYNNKVRNSIHYTKYQLTKTNSQSFRSAIQSSAKERRPRCMLKITSPLRIKWDLIVIFLAIYNCFSIPVYLAFESSSYYVFLLVFDYGIEIVFVLDILMNFRTTYIDIQTGNEITDCWKIFKNYMKNGRLFIDVLATVPFDIMASILGREDDLLRLFTLLKLVRITRLSKIILYMRTQESVKLFLRLLRAIIFLFMYLHLAACLWYYIVQKEQLWYPVERFYDQTLSTRYFQVLYASVGLWVGIELNPQTLEEMIFCSLVILMGSMVTAVLFGEFALLATSFNRAIINFNKVNTQIDTTMKNLKLPKKLQYKILDYLVSTQNNITQQKELKQFEEEIPPSLRAEVNKVLFKEILVRSEIFEQLPSATKEIISKTHTLFYKPEDEVFKQHDEAEGIFFLLIGEAEVVVDNLLGTVSTCRVLVSGDFFGEIGVLFRCKRTASIQVKAYATIARIGNEDFDNVVQKHPVVAEKLKQRAANVYDDHLTKKIEHIMRKIAYVRNLNDLQYMHLLFAMKREHIYPNKVIVNYGDCPKKVYILLEGSVDVHFLLRGKKTNYKMKVLEVEDYILQKTFTIRKKPEEDTCEKQFDLFVCKLEGISILCASQALIKAPVSVKLTTASHCDFLVLKYADINDIAMNVEGSLRANITLLRNRHLESRHDKIIVNTPILDYFQFSDNHIEKFKFKIRLKLKHFVLKMIMKARRKLRTEGFSIVPTVNRLVQIRKMLGVSWQEFRKIVESGKILPEDISVAHVLHWNQKNPIVTHMAIAFQSMMDSKLFMENRLRGFGEILGSIKQENEKNQENIKGFQEISDYLRVMTLS